MRREKESEWLNSSLTDCNARSNCVGARHSLSSRSLTTDESGQGLQRIENVDLEAPSARERLESEALR
jgi:hypothetical protein